MTKINLGLFFLIIAIVILAILYVKTDKNYMFVMDQLEIINSKLDHLEYDLHELEEK
mgnify:CR=1 FL=1